jgi:hypothetical protein
VSWLTRTLVVVFVATAACIVTDPPGTLPRLPETRPTIVRPMVIPPASAVVGGWPKDGKFVVYVELADPTVQFDWSSFVDYNPLTGEGLIDVDTSVYTPENADAKNRTRVLNVLIPEPSPDRCHTVEVVVALRLKAKTDPINAHTPDEPGGDSVTWFVNPTGDFAGCPVLDAGSIDAGQADGGLPDGDSGDGGPQ